MNSEGDPSVIALSRFRRVNSQSDFPTDFRGISPPGWVSVDRDHVHRPVAARGDDEHFGGAFDRRVGVRNEALGPAAHGHRDLTGLVRSPDAGGHVPHPAHYFVVRHGVTVSPQVDRAYGCLVRQICPVADLDRESSEAAVGTSRAR